MRNAKNEVSDTKKIMNGVTKESMVVKRKHDDNEKRYSTIKERQEKVYPFSNFDVADMLKKLLDKQSINYHNADN